MFERILFPTDFSEHARVAMNCIVGLPGVREIILLHVIQSGPFSQQTVRESQVSQVRDKLEASRSFLLHLGQQKVKSVILKEDSVSGGIISTAEKEDVSIIVMEAKSRGYIEGLHLGSVSLRVLHDTSKNILILRSLLIEGLQGKQYQRFCSQILSRVLVSIDLSPESLRVVREIAKVPGLNELIICYCLPRGTMESETGSARDEALAKIEAACKGVIPAELLFRTRILAGVPVEEVKQYAHESEVSLICSVRHGKGTIDEMIHGSFTCELASYGHHPILIYRNNQI